MILKPSVLCKKVILYFENGEVEETLISSEFSNVEIERMGVGLYYNLGTKQKEDKQLCIRVEIEEYEE